MTDNKRHPRMASSPESLPAHVDATIRRLGLVMPSEKLLVAVSGGCDSMVLLDLLHRLSKDHAWELAVAHFNHQLRGRASEADESFVRQQAEQRGLVCFVDRGDVRAAARVQGWSLEMAARALRLRFLVTTARTWGARKVALAHHADDQVELFFLRVLRGSGGAGLEGMRWASPAPVPDSGPGSTNEPIHFIRPLLDCWREQLREYAAQQGLPFREDRSNRSADILRNRIRMELLPRLERRFQPGVRRTVLRLMDLVGADAAAVRLWAERWWRTRRPAFEQLPVAVQRAVLRLQLWRRGHEPTYDLVEHLRLQPGRRVSAGPGLWFVRDPEGRIRPAPPGSLSFRTGAITLELLPKGQACFAGVELNWEILPVEGRARVRPRPCREFMDADRIGTMVRVRFWRPGDRFQPLGFPRPAKLQDLFTAAKIPTEERRRRLVGETAGGTIFWVEGLPPGQAFRVTPETRRQLLWQWCRSADCHVAAGEPPC